MHKTLSVRGSQTLLTHLRSADGDTVPLRTFFESLAESLDCLLAMIVTTLPRGTMQIAQPTRVNESVIKAYGRQLHAEDRCAWEAVARGEAVRGEDCFQGKSLEASAFYEGLLAPNNLRYVAAVPLESPV